MIDWSVLPRPPHGAPCPGAIVTSVSGEAYIPHALCWAKQLRHLNHTCPIVIVYDDVDRSSARISMASLASLRSAATSVIPLSSLVQRAQSDPAVGWHGPLPTHWVQRRARRRRLLSDGLLASNKLWLWGLDAKRFPRCLYMDTDVAILHNLDALLHLEFSEPIAAVGAAPLCQSRSFNSGLLIFKPSAHTLAKLLFASRVVGWPWRGEMPDFDAVRIGPGGEPLSVVRIKRSWNGAASWPRTGLPQVPRRDESQAAWEHRATHATDAGQDGRNWSLSAAELCAPSGCSRPGCIPALNIRLPSVGNSNHRHEASNESQSPLLATAQGPLSPRHAVVQQALYACQSKHVARALAHSCPPSLRVHPHAPKTDTEP